MSDCFFRKELTEMGIRKDMKEIEMKMHELEDVIHFKFKDIWNLANAMCVIDLYSMEMVPVKKNEPDYYNSSLATFGDAVAKVIISERLFKSGFCKGKITEVKKETENNSSLHEVVKEKEIYKYAFNQDYFFEEALGECQLPNPKHDLYFEAIVGAVYFDSGFDKCKEWINEYYVDKKLNNIN